MWKFPGRAAIPATLVIIFYLLWLRQQWTAKAPQAKCCKCTFPECRRHELPPTSRACFILLLSVRNPTAAQVLQTDHFRTCHPLCKGFPAPLLQGSISSSYCKPFLHQGHSVRLVNMLEKTQITSATSEEVFLSKKNNPNCSALTAFSPTFTPYSVLLLL